MDYLIELEWSVPGVKEENTINNLYMEFMNKIDKLKEGITDIQHSFMSTEMFT